MKIAIGYNPRKTSHSTSWHFVWINYCKKNNIPYELVDCYQLDIINKLKDFTHFLWHFGNYEFQDMIFARSILYSAKSMGLKIFPDYNTAWHFDDKVAETFLLQSIQAPIPKSQVFFSYDECTKWAKENQSKLPVVAKLRGGSGSHNVKLLNSLSDVEKYAKTMFSEGFDPSPSLIYKTASNVKSAKDLKTVIKRLKRVPEFLRTLSSAKEFPREKQYVFFQEFIPNNGFDLKVVAIGDKLSFIGRSIRKDDFRASGGGSLFYDKSLIPKNVIDSAFRINDKLSFQCMGYDYVVNNNTEEGIIVEISYGFSHEALLGAGGYFDKEGVWHNEPLNAPEEVLKNLISDSKK